MGIESLNSILNNKKKVNIEYSILNAKRNKRNYSERDAKNKAIYLVDKFRNPKGMQFYLKCAWNLTDSYIDWLVEYSFKKDNPSRYFVFVANKKMQELA